MNPWSIGYLVIGLFVAFVAAVLITKHDDRHWNERFGHDAPTYFAGLNTVMGIIIGAFWPITGTIGGMALLVHYVSRGKVTT